jgi:predicted metalloendopeptidase
MPFAAPRLVTVLALTLAVRLASAQTAGPAAPATPPVTHYTPGPAFDTVAIDLGVDPCTDFYQYACGHFATLHPIPADQTEVDQFYQLYNVDLAPIQPLLDQIDKVSKAGLPYLAGELQRIGVTAFFSFSEGQDLKDSTKQVAYVDQGGLGLPERDYYTRTGEKDKLIRQQYAQHILNMLTFGGETPQQALIDSRNILAFETKLAQASLTNVERRDPEVLYHPQTLADFESSIKPVALAPFLEAIHAPAALDGPMGPHSLVNETPRFFPAMVQAVLSADIQTLRAYLRYHTLDTFAGSLPKRFDAESFNFHGRQLAGQPEQQPRWKRCSSRVDAQLGEALGQVYVQQYFAGDSKAKTLEMVTDIEAAMDRDIDTLDWMGAATKLKAKEKLHAVANKIGYPDHWRDYSKLAISATDAFGNSVRATAFENDRELDKIGQPVDKLEWEMSPPTVNAYYDPSMNNINFPAGILQPAFYDPKADLAVNYGHMGSIIGHELTHGFDDEGKKFDAAGNLTDWWTPEDTKKFEARTGCLVDEYSKFTAVPDPKEPAMVNGKLTLGENTADNGGLVLAFMAYLDRAKKTGVDPATKIDGFTGPQRFYIAYAQNWCENSRPQSVRQQVLTDPHSPDHFRANGAIVNQPGFANAFSCKKGTPMVPANSCRVW